MENIPTANDVAHKWLAFFAPRVGFKVQHNIDGAMIEFAKAHVKAALENVHNRVKGYDNIWINTSYPLENIK